MDCPHCSRGVRAKERFCVHCGRALTGDAVTRATSQETRAAVQAATLQYLGVLLLVLLARALRSHEETPSSTVVDSSLFNVALVTVGVVGALRIGDWKSCVGNSASLGEIGLGAGIAIPVLGLNLVVIGLFSVMMGGEFLLVDWEIPEDFALLIIAIAVLPALCEEWVCRGVLWASLRRVSDARMTLILTSVLFALLHGLGGAGFLELPTRFLAGLVLGWLRLRTKSLWPSIAAHFVNNALAVWLS